MEKQIYSADLLRKYFFNNRCIIFEVTNDCNLDCSYCTYGELYNTRGINKKSGINLNLAKVFINFMVDIWNSSQVSSFKTNIWVGFYGGEPLLAFEDIRSLVEFTKEKELLFNKVKFSMTTNGILLDKYIDL